MPLSFNMLHTAWESWYRKQKSRMIRMRHCIVQCSRVNHHIFAIKGECETIQAWGPGHPEIHRSRYSETRDKDT